MEIVSKVNAIINSFVWGPIIILFVIGTGIFISIRTGFFQVTKIPLWVKGTFARLGVKSEDKKNISPFQAVTASLATTIGTGNIAGIATIIIAAGPGTVFWMWVAAFFGMIIKYAEIVLAVK